MRIPGEHVQSPAHNICSVDCSVVYSVQRAISSGDPASGSVSLSGQGALHGMTLYSVQPIVNSLQFTSNFYNVHYTVYNVKCKRMTQYLRDRPNAEDTGVQGKHRALH